MLPGKSEPFQWPWPTSVPPLNTTQVWPASFKDSNGDGLGDIQGIISKLDHIKDLGVGTIWLSPFYSSPQVDLGYDISNYEDVYPPYGTLHDVEQLIAETHARDMHVIFDLVINHTSDQHAWFQESRRSRSNSKSDWYIWKDSKIVDGKKTPPNNWVCCRFSVPFLSACTDPSFRPSLLEHSTQSHIQCI